MRYHLFKKFFEKVVKIKEMSFLLSKCKNSIAHHCNPRNTERANAPKKKLIKVFFIGGHVCDDFLLCETIAAGIRLSLTEPIRR